MSSDWKRLGFLTPDAYDAQREVWALQAGLRAVLGDVLDALASRTAEPTWAASLADAGERSRVLVRQLVEEAGEPICAQVADDGQVRELDAALGEVVGSGHPPSLMVAGYATLGELATLPVRLLDEVAGPHARLLCGRVTGADEHRVLARLLELCELSRGERDDLRRMLRHLHGLLFGVYQSWRQTLHTLGVDGEWLAEEAATTLRAAYATLGLPATEADLRPVRG